MNKKRRTGIYIVTALVCLLTLAGCGRKYEPVEVPTLEEASGDITLENGEETAAVSIENETGNGKNGTEKPGGQAGTSAHEAAVTTETAPAFTAVDETVYVTGSQVNIRKSAGTGGAVITTVSRGTALKRTGYSDSWSRIIYQDQECYISCQRNSRLRNRRQRLLQSQAPVPARSLPSIRDTRRRAIQKKNR